MDQYGSLVYKSGSCVHLIMSHVKPGVVAFFFFCVVSSIISHTKNLVDRDKTRHTPIHMLLCLAAAQTIKQMTRAGECWQRKAVYS